MDKLVISSDMADHFKLDLLEIEEELKAGRPITELLLTLVNHQHRMVEALAVAIARLEQNTIDLQEHVGLDAFSPEKPEIYLGRFE